MAHSLAAHPNALDGMAPLLGQNAHMADVDDDSEESESLPLSEVEIPAVISARTVRVKSELRIKETKRVLKLALPSAIADTIAFVASLFAVAQVGHLGSKELAAMTMGSTLYNITGLSVIHGLTSAMDTFASQVYGAGQHGALGVILQRSSIVCSLCSVPCMLLWTQAQPLLVLLGQDPQISAAAAEYVLLCAPALILSSVRQCCRSYFMSQGDAVPGTITTLLAVVLTPLYNYLFITYLGLGLPGAAYAYVVDELTGLIVIIALMIRHELMLPPDMKTWPGLSLEAFKGWGAYLGVALPSTAMICLDWWILEVMILLAGLRMSTSAEEVDVDVSVATMGLCFDVFTLVFFSVDGFGSAAATRVGHELGAGRPTAARRASLTSVWLGLAACATSCGVVYTFRHNWITLFTNSPAISHHVLSALPWVSLAVVGYSGNTVLSGVLRGAGRQHLGFMINLVSLWFVGLPLAVVLRVFYGCGPSELWMALAVMNGLQALALAVSVWRFDWEREVERSQDFVSLYTPLMVSEPGSDGDDTEDGDRSMDSSSSYACKQREKEKAGAGMDELCGNHDAGFDSMNEGLHDAAAAAPDAASGK